MPKALLDKLPLNAKRLWEAAYKNSRSKGNSQTVSAKVAMSVVTKAYKKQDGVWVKKHLNLKLHLIKHGWLFPSYKFELELSNDKWDSDNQMVSPELLKRFVDQNKIASSGDIDHERYYRKTGNLNKRDLINNDLGTEGLYMLDSYKYENGSIKAIVGMNSKHALYDKYLDYHRKGKFLFASAEFPNATIENGNIIDADEMLWSITDNPAGDVSQGKIIG